MITQLFIVCFVVTLMHPPHRGSSRSLCIIGIIINTCKYRLGHSITIFTGYFRAKEKLLIIQFSTFVFNKYCHKNTFSIFNQQMHIVLEVCELCKKSDPHARHEICFGACLHNPSTIFTPDN